MRREAYRDASLLTPHSSLLTPHAPHEPRSKLQEPHLRLPARVHRLLRRRGSPGRRCWGAPPAHPRRATQRTPGRAVSRTRRAPILPVSSSRSRPATTSTAATSSPASTCPTWPMPSTRCSADTRQPVGFAVRTSDLRSAGRAAQPSGRTTGSAAPQCGPAVP